jgi:hypothetical protein
MARPDGTTARLALPDWQGAHIQLSIFFYPFTLRRVREALEGSRSGLTVIEVAAPINAPTLECVLDRRDLYLHGWREQGTPVWNRFTPKIGKPPDLPGGRHVNLPSDGSYPDLGMRGLGRTDEITPVKLLADLAACRGSIAGPDGWVKVLLLILLVPEALRFDSVMLEGMRWLSSGRYDVASVADTVTNWAKSSAAGSRNVLLRHIP